MKIPKKSKLTKKHKFIIGTIIILLIGGIIALIVYFATKKSLHSHSQSHSLH